MLEAQVLETSRVLGLRVFVAQVLQLVGAKIFRLCGWYFLRFPVRNVRRQD